MKKTKVLDLKKIVLEVSPDAAKKAVTAAGAAAMTLMTSNKKKKNGKKKKSAFKQFSDYKKLLDGIADTAAVHSAVKKVKQNVAKVTGGTAAKKSDRVQEKKNAVTVEQAEMIEL